MPLAAMVVMMVLGAVATLGVVGYLIDKSADEKKDQGA